MAKRTHIDIPVNVNLFLLLPFTNDGRAVILVEYFVCVYIYICVG